MPDRTIFTEHGGALDAAHRLFPTAPRPWLDLSTGINPVPYPFGALAKDVWARLPTLADLAQLETVAARRYGAPEGAAVVAVPGSQVLIQRLPDLCGGRDVRVLGRTYGELTRVFRAADRQVRVEPSLEALAGADVAIVVNPNNPDGSLVAPADLHAMFGRVGMLVVDEAFMDFLPAAASLAPRTASGRTIVLRSFGKAYGLAGLRLGFGIMSPSLAERLRRLLGPWPVSGPALAIGTVALQDDGWLDAARSRSASSSSRLRYLLRQAGATYIGGTPLFTLIAHPAAPRVFARLAGAGILTRPFADEPSWLRFGLPAEEADWTRLQATLASFG